MDAHSCSFDDLVRRVLAMTEEEKAAFAARTLRLVESAGFETLSSESQDRCWVVLDLCTQ